MSSLTLPLLHHPLAPGGHALYLRVEIELRNHAHCNSYECTCMHVDAFTIALHGDCMFLYVQVWLCKRIPVHACTKASPNIREK